ncbi:hypothetical protein AO377_1246 [Moraxella catarrhalis]|nr:hypothetical protein AO377_1246 [Moraxella catarrhalis]OAV13203.1 hypothetical protein AO375_1607 [Moraxella catarrhalis]OAV36314.1 hypothetical protein AO365_0709 [Moraxella catarrhalis]
MRLDKDLMSSMSSSFRVNALFFTPRRALLSFWIWVWVLGVLVIFGMVLDLFLKMSYDNG